MTCCQLGSIVWGGSVWCYPPNLQDLQSTHIVSTKPGWNGSSPPSFSFQGEARCFLLPYPELWGPLSWGRWRFVQPWPHEWARVFSATSSRCCTVEKYFISFAFCGRRRSLSSSWGAWATQASGQSTGACGDVLYICNNLKLCSGIDEKISHACSVTLGVSQKHADTVVIRGLLDYFSWRAFGTAEMSCGAGGDSVHCKCNG